MVVRATEGVPTVPTFQMFACNNTRIILAIRLLLQVNLVSYRCTCGCPPNIAIPVGGYCRRIRAPQHRWDDPLPLHQRSWPTNYRRGLEDALVMHCTRRSRVCHRVRAVSLWGGAITLLGAVCLH